MVGTYPRPPRSATTYEDGDGFIRDYRPGYEPSAPPYHSAPDYYPSSSSSVPHSSPSDEFLERPLPRHEDEFPRSTREPYFGPADEHETLGGYLLHRMVQPVWRSSRTVLRIDLRRSLKYNGPAVGRGRGRRRRGDGPAGTSASVGGRDYYDEEEEAHASRGWMNAIEGGGARLKLMQVWDAPQHLIGEARKHWDINFGLGMNVELDKGQLQPKLRLKARHVALHLLPVPEIELRGKWPVAGTRLAINAKYRIPLATTFEEIWSSSGARLMISFFNPLNTGLHLTPGGLEFDEHLTKLGDHTKLRLAATVDFPRKFPLEEGEQALRLRVHRLGLKTVIMPGVTEKEENRHPDGSQIFPAV